MENYEGLIVESEVQVQVDAKDGLLFKSTHDRKVVVVDPQAQSPGDYSTRIELETTECIQAIIFDHFIGKQAWAHGSLSTVIGWI